MCPWHEARAAARVQTAAKMEHGDPTVTLDLLAQALFRMGMTRKDVAALI